MERLGLRVRYYRELRGLSLREIGAAVGVTAQSVYKWEKGRSAVPAQDVPTIAATLGVRVCELYGVEEEHPAGALAPRPPVVDPLMADIARAVEKHLPERAQRTQEQRDTEDLERIFNESTDEEKRLLAILARSWEEMSDAGMDR